MTKKKKRQNPEIDELLARPWCYYCERDFDDLKILIHHQKAKHFKCERCARRLNTAGGLRVHMDQVHKETLEAVENAISGRESVELEIFGTEGIPESEVAAHNQRIMAEFAQKEADRRAASGQGGNGPKRPKIDISKELDPEEIKKKLEAHKKAMATGSATPSTPAGASMSPGRSQSPGQFDNRSPQVPPQAYPQAASPPAFQPGFPPPQGGYPPANFPSQQPQSQFPNAFAPPFQQQPPQQPAQFGRGGGPQSQFNVPPGAPVFNPFPGQPQQHQGPPHQPRHQSGPLPQPHQIPGLPPKPNVPGLPPRPAFTQPGQAGFGRGGPPAWTPPGHAQRPPQGPSQQLQNVPPAHQQQQHQQQQAPPGGFNARSPPPGVGYGAGPQFGAPPGQGPQYGFSVPPQQAPPPGYGPQGSPHPMPAQSNGPPRNATPTTPTVPTSGVNDLAIAETADEAKEKAATAAATAAAKPKRETKLVYSDNDVSPVPSFSIVSCCHHHPIYPPIQLLTRRQRNGTSRSNQPTASWELYKALFGYQGWWLVGF